MICPPYSPEFVQLFLEMVESEEITGSMRQGDGDHDSVSEFIGEERTAHFIYFLLSYSLSLSIGIFKCWTVHLFSSLNYTVHYYLVLSFFSAREDALHSPH